MKNISRLALGLGSALLFASSASIAGEDLPNGTYGDPNVATFIETKSGATIEFACNTAEFVGAIPLEGKNFAVVGTYGSTLQAQSDWSKVLMTGTYSPGGCDKFGACFPTTLDVTLTAVSTLAPIGTWSFVLGDEGVTKHCG